MRPGNPQNFFKGGFALQEFFDSILPEGVNAFFYGLGAQRFRIRFCLDQFSDWLIDRNELIDADPAQIPRPTALQTSFYPEKALWALSG